MKSALSNLNLQNSIMREAWRDLKKKKNKISLLYYVQKFQKKLLEDDSRK